MSTFLNQLAIESGAVDPIAAANANPEEITVVTDDTTTELDESLQELASDVEEARDQNDAAEKMIDAIECLEGKLVMMRDMRDQGIPLSAEAAVRYSNSVVIALEGRRFPAALYSGNMNDFVLSVESRASYDYSAEAEEKTESLASKLKAMLSKALDAFIQFMKNLWSRGQGLNKNITELGNALIKRAQKLGSDTGQVKSTDTDISIKGLSMIASSTTAVDPAAALDTISTASKKLASNEGKMAEALGKLSVSAAAGGKQDTTEAAKILASVDDIALFGGRKLEVSDKGQYVIAGESITVDGKAKPLSPTQIKELGNKLITVGGLMEINQTDQKAMISKLESSINKVVQSLGEDVKEGKSRVMKDFTLGLATLRSGRAELNKYAAQVAKQAYRFGSASANRH